jgi:hexokinase
MAVFQVLELMKPFFITDEGAEKIRAAFKEQIELGLAKSPPKKSTLQMANTFIPELPDGTGTYAHQQMPLYVPKTLWYDQHTLCFSLE